MRFLTLLACLTGAAPAQIPIDFSYAGYGGGPASPPRVAPAISVRPTGGDDTVLLQQAIERGPVLLMPGRYRVAGHLEIRKSGAVVRGSGAANTTIVAVGKSRRTLIEIGATADPATDAPLRVTDETVPAGALTLTVDSAQTLHRGDRVVVMRPSTAEWIAAIKMRGFPGNYANLRLDWAPGSRNLVWDRTIAAVDGNRVSLDAPITTALERRYGGGTMARVSGRPPVTQVGIEDVTLESEVDPANPRDEAHSWIAIAMDRVEDAWVRGVVARRFAMSAVRVGPRARQVTIEACASREPVSEPGGYRRQSFLVEGQQVLVRACISEHGMNDFAAGLLAGGPNVVLDSTATGALGPSGSFESWASGVLYERVRILGAGLRLTNDSSRAEGAGWTAANSVAWNCAAAEIEAKGPEGAANIANRAAESLYETQLLKRTRAKLPPLLAAAPAARAPEFRAAKTAAAPPAPAKPVEVVNGRFVADGKVLWGGVINDGWWRGSEVPASALDVGGIAITRFVPGRTGPGLTEDLAALAAKMIADGTPFYQMIPGLWYDRRRDEHSIVSRPDGSVWAPFYEMPWARSGKQGETAADGLSKFDLTQFNPWYFDRLAEFGALCDRHGLVLYHNIYNTHNLLEIPPHWVDYPWRGANNVNGTAPPEPMPIEPGNHIHVANQVYDVSNPVHRALHRALILHELDALGGVRNLFFSLGAQFAGPLSFQEFFQDTIAEWEQAHGRSVRIQLATSKEITDTILADPVRGRQVAVIDVRYWQYRPDGKLWAPAGGRNLAFREMIGADFGRAGDQPPDTTPQQVYRQVREYHDRYPDKAIVAWHGGAGAIPVLMAGGAEVLLRNPSGGHGQGRTVEGSPIDKFVREQLGASLMKMEPRDGVAGEAWCLADTGFDTVLLYSLSGETVALAKPLPRARYTGMWVDPRTGSMKAVEGEVGTAIPKPSSEAWLLLLRSPGRVPAK
jgi:hypothetical protein